MYCMNKREKSGISFIIPCYNSRSTIGACLNSLLNDLVEVEAIVIDDCSNESIEDIVNSYRNEKISIVYRTNPTNIGAGKTRNIGLHLASKDYVCFLDSDDQLSPDFFNKVNPFINQYDEIVYDAHRVYSSEKKYMKMFYSNKIRPGEVVPAKALALIKGCTCGKIYRRKPIIENNVIFAELPRNEDTVFTKVATSFMDSIYYIGEPLYLYIDSSSSLMNNRHLTSIDNARRAFDIINERLWNRNFGCELNSLYFIEILYSTTNTNLALGLSIDKVRSEYRERRMHYSLLNDKYWKYYMIKYKLVFFIFEFNLFQLYKKFRGF